MRMWQTYMVESRQQTQIS